MSISESIMFNCPHCGYRQNAEVWSSINVTADPDLRKKLFQGQINSNECFSCLESISIEAPLMYYDLENRFCVQYFPSGLLDDPEFFGGFSLDGTPLVGSPEDFPESVLATSPYIHNPDIVFSMEEMVLHILFRERLKKHFDNRTPYSSG